MKKILFVFIFISAIKSELFCQTFTLLDRRWYKPALFSDSISRNDLSEGWYPVYTAELDSLTAMLSKLKNLRNDGLDRKFYYSEDFKTTHSSFQIENIKRTYGDGYEINLITSTPMGSNTLKLSDPDLKLTANQVNVRAFLSYLISTQKNISNPSKRKKYSTRNNPNVN